MRQKGQALVVQCFFAEGGADPLDYILQSFRVFAQQALSDKTASSLDRAKELPHQ